MNTSPSQATLAADLILIQTPTSGRALIATRTIPADTPILIAPAPFAHVIYRTFRKEVCAACFKYARDDGKMVWNIRWVSGTVDNGGGGKNKLQGGGTAYFCTDSCKDSWNIGVGPLLGEVNIALDKASQQIKKSKARTSSNKAPSESEVEPKQKSASNALRTTSELQDLVDLITHTRSPEGDITQETLNTAWNLADIFVNSANFTSSFDRAVVQLDLDLDEMELEVARLAASAIVQRYFEETIDVPGTLLSLSSSKDLPYDTEIPSIPSSPVIHFPSWSSLLSLQPNELSNVQERAYDLGVHVRVYVFLAHVLRTRHVLSFMGGTSGRKAQMKTSGLAVYVQTSEMVRAVLARDPGNAFGIWELGQSVRSYLDGVEASGEQKEEGSTMDSKEMLGWGIWPEASYFNHSCSPNVVKKRIARNLVFVTTSVVQKGEELCIAYVDCDEIQTTKNDEFAAGEKRKELLRKWWFFGCACTRCSLVEREMGEE